MKTVKKLVLILVLFSLQITKAQCTFTSSVPYLEGFSSIASNNQLPMCWTASNLGITCLTNIAPSKHAAFHNVTSGVSYFYSNGLQLYTGYTYSASVWYKTDASLSQNWTDLSIMLGSNQNNSGHVSLASTGGPAASSSYASLSGTFTVVNSGIYYLSVRGTGSAGSSPYLYWDVLSVIIPCGLNTPSMLVSTSQNTVCSGSTATLFTAGTHSFMWSTGATSSVTTILPNTGSIPANTIITVTGTDALSNCSTQSVITINILPMPIVILQNWPPSICPGEMMTFSVSGANNYLWSTSAVTSSISIPNFKNNTYYVTGTNSYGCSATTSLSASIQIKPTILASTANTILCNGDQIKLEAAGGTSYSWLTPNTILTGATIFANPTVNTTFTLIGFNEDNCSDSTTVKLNIVECTGIETQSGIENTIYYDHVSEKLILNTLVKGLCLTDITGHKIPFEITETLQRYEINMSTYSAGIYIIGDANNELRRLKFIKN